MGGLSIFSPLNGEVQFCSFYLVSGFSDVPVSSSNVKPSAIKSADMATPKATRAPRAPSSNVSTAGSDSKPPPTPATTSKGMCCGAILLLIFVNGWLS